MKRKIITIDETLCDGCGNCVPGCPEGVLQVIDGKARLVGDLFCDGLGACVGECPTGAMTVTEREAEPYDERRVMENIVCQGTATIGAHLRHLKDHGEEGFLSEALRYLRDNGYAVPEGFIPGEKQELPIYAAVGCPGSMAREIPASRGVTSGAIDGLAPSELTQWPIQLHLINPLAPYFRGADLLVAADCVGFSLGAFHRALLRGRKLIILCPKLDHGTEVYLEKLTTLFERQDIRSVTVAHMEVPCCSGAVRIVETALDRAGKDIPLSDRTITINGGMSGEEKTMLRARA